jgi:hypothetical protein
VPTVPTMSVVRRYEGGWGNEVQSPEARQKGMCLGSEHRLCFAYELLCGLCSDTPPFYTCFRQRSSAMFCCALLLIAADANSWKQFVKSNFDVQGGGLTAS